MGRHVPHEHLVVGLPPHSGRQDGAVHAGESRCGPSTSRSDFEVIGNVDAAVIHGPGDLRVGQEGLPLCLIGDWCTGKSHLLIVLGNEAATVGFRVRYTLATKLVDELVEAAADEKS